LLKAEVVVYVGKPLQHAFIERFLGKTCFLQYPRMAGDAWQKNLQGSGSSGRMPTIDFHNSQFNSLLPLQACRLLDFFFVCSQFMFMQFTEGKYEQYTTRYRVCIIWNGVIINAVLKNHVNTRPH